MNSNQKWIGEQKYKNNYNYCPCHRNIQPIFQNNQNQKSYNITKKTAINQYYQNSRTYQNQHNSKNLFINMDKVPSQGFITSNNNQKYDPNKYFLSGPNYKYYANNTNTYKKIQKTEIIPEMDGIVRNFTHNYSLLVSKNTSSKNGPFEKQNRSAEMREIKYNNNSNNINQQYKKIEQKVNYPKQNENNYRANFVKRVIVNKKNINNNNENVNYNNANVNYRRYSDYNDDKNNFSEQDNIYQNKNSNNNKNFERIKSYTISTNRPTTYSQKRIIRTIVQKEEKPIHQRGFYSELEPNYNARLAYINNVEKTNEIPNKNNYKSNNINERKNNYHKYTSSKNQQGFVVENSYIDDLKEYEPPKKYNTVETKQNIYEYKPRNYNNNNSNFSKKEIIVQNQKTSHSETKNINNRNNSLEKNNNNKNNYKNFDQELYYESSHPSFPKRHTETLQSRYEINKYQNNNNKKYTIKTENPSLNSHYASRTSTNYHIIKKPINKNDFSTFQNNLTNIRELDDDNNHSRMQIYTSKNINHSFYISKGYSGKQKYHTSTTKQAYRSNNYILRDEEIPKKNYEFYAKNEIQSPENYYHIVKRSNNINNYYYPKIEKKENIIQKENKYQQTNDEDIENEENDENNEYIVENIVTNENDQNDDNNEYYEEDEDEDVQLEYDPTQLMASKEDNFGFVSQSPKINDDENDNEIEQEVEENEQENNEEEENNENENNEEDENNEEYYEQPFVNIVKKNENDANKYKKNINIRKGDYQISNQSKEYKNEEKGVNHNFHESRQVKSTKNKNFNIYHRRADIQKPQKQKITTVVTFSNNDDIKNEEQEDKEEDYNPNDNNNVVNNVNKESKYGSYFGDMNNNYYESQNYEENQDQIKREKQNIQINENKNKYTNLKISNTNNEIKNDNKNNENDNENNENENENNENDNENENENDNNEYKYTNLEISSPTSNNKNKNNVISFGIQSETLCVPAEEQNEDEEVNEEVEEQNEDQNEVEEQNEEEMQNEDEEEQIEDAQIEEIQGDDDEENQEYVIDENEEQNQEYEEVENGEEEGNENEEMIEEVEDAQEDDNAEDVEVEEGVYEEDNEEEN